MSEPTALEKLKAAAARKPATATTSAPEVAAAPAAAAPAPVPAPAAVVTPATATPPPAAAVAPAAVPAPASAPVNQLSVVTSVSNDEDAKRELSRILGSDDGAEVADTFAALDGQAGVAFAQPFAQIKKNNWDVHSSVANAILEFMPAGNRPFTMVYLGYRVGATVWPAVAKPDGKPPLYRFALPSRRMYTGATELTRQTLAIGSKCQYKNYKLEALRANSLGKLSPETHIFGWTRETGFIILSVPGYSSSKLTCEQLADEAIKDCIGQVPLVFKLELDKVINKNAKPGDDNYEWINPYVAVEARPTEQKTLTQLKDWQDFLAKNQVEVANQVIAFNRASDFKGLVVEDVAKNLAKYDVLNVG